MKRIMKWGIAVMAMILFISAIIFFPEYVIKENDNNDLNQYHLYEQEGADITNIADTDLSLKEKLEILTAGPKEKEMIVITESEDVQEILEDAPDLFEKLESQIRLLEEAKLISTVSEQLEWEDLFFHAELVACSKASEPKKILYIWDLSFLSLEQSEETMTFAIDAFTYKIYEFDIVGEWVDSYYYDYVNENWSNESFYEFTTEWMENYIAYLQEGEDEAGREVINKESVIQDYDEYEKNQFTFDGNIYMADGNNCEVVVSMYYYEDWKNYEVLWREQEYTEMSVGIDEEDG